MEIQQHKPVPIIGLIKDPINPKKRKVLFKDMGWGDTTVENLLSNLEFHLSKIDQHLRSDLFFTIAEVQDGDKARELVIQKYLPFDIDGIDQLKKEETAQAVCECLGIQFNETLIIFTGGGLHLGLYLANPINSLEDLQKMRAPYVETCKIIDKFLRNRGLKGTADNQMLSQGRMFRLPGTVNTKYGTAGIETELLNKNIKLVEFNLVDFSGKELTKLEKREKANPDYVAMVPRLVDKDAVVNGCKFLLENESNAATLSEPYWFGDIGIRAFLPGGRDDIHRIHSIYSGYNKAETDEKIDMVLKNQTGPRKCKSVEGLGFDCSKCPHYTKVASPIQIHGPDFITTKETGFRVPNPKKPSDQWKVSYDDLVKEFTLDHEFFTSPENGKIYVYKGHHWRNLNELEAYGWAYEKIKPSAVQHERREFHSTLQAQNHRDVKSLLNSTYRRVNFQNGVFDATSMEFVEHSPSFGFHYILPFSYDPNAQCPRFDSFLKEVLPDDEGNQKAIIEFIGYGLFNDDCWLQKALFLEGEGSNGKSTLIEIIGALTGKDNYLSIDLAELVAKDTKRAQLEHKLFCLSEETKASSLVESDLFKQLVSGGNISVKQIYVKDYNIDNRAKFIMSFNNLTTSRDKTHALYRRMRKIPFNQIFKIDRSLKPALMAELPGIFNRVLEAYERLHVQQALTESDISDRALEVYKQDNDPGYAFLLEHYEPIEDEDYKVLKNEIYQEFSQYFDDQGLSQRYKPDIRNFTKSLKSYMGNLYRESRLRTEGRQRSIVNLKKKELD